MTKIDYIKQRPVGTTNVIAAAVVVVAVKLGLDLTETEAAALVGGVGALVSLRTPRT